MVAPRRVPLAASLWLVLAATACVHGSGSPREGDVVRRHVSLRNGFLRVEIAIPLGHAGARPAVIAPLGEERALLERGLAVVDFHHDWSPLRELGVARETEQAPQPVGKALLASPRPGVIGRSYFGLVALGARRSIPAIVDHLETLPEIDAGRIAVAGSSTRGFMALEALTVEPRLAAGVVRVACGDYRAFLRESSLALAGEERWLDDGELDLDADYAETLRGREPVRLAERLPPRPLLLLAGAEDPVVPPACTRPTERAFEAAYAEAGVPERFRFVLYEKRGHDLGDDAVRESLEWWDRWLLGTTSATVQPTTESREGGP